HRETLLAAPKLRPLHGLSDGSRFAKQPGTMNCPECHAAYESGSTVCTSCGLILINSAQPKRRAEDLASAKRRAADQVVPCQFCKGEIRMDAIRCRHCSEIVNEDYYRQRAQRVRARV